MHKKLGVDRATDRGMMHCLSMANRLTSKGNRSREKRSPAKNAKRPILAVPQNKRSREGSNLRPTDPQSVALSTELRDHLLASKAAPEKHFSGVCRSTSRYLPF